jgi:hypothetical protein
VPGLEAKSETVLERKSMKYPRTSLASANSPGGVSSYPNPLENAEFQCRMSFLWKASCVLVPVPHLPTPAQPVAGVNTADSHVAEAPDDESDCFELEELKSMAIVLRHTSP